MVTSSSLVVSHSTNNIETPTMAMNIDPGKLSGDLKKMVLSTADPKITRVKVIYTGGTIGMVRNEDNVLVNIPNALPNRIREYPDMHDKQYAKEHLDDPSMFVLPYVEGESNRVLYKIFEYNPLLDSSNMSMSDWTRIAEDIYESYESYDGFVVLHGTDTMAFTASALSFMLEYLGKTVIITGSQIPIFETRTDGKDNFISSLVIAGYYVVPEVCVLFGSKLMRGNRTIKYNCDALDAFDSLNVPKLGRIGVNVEINNDLIFRPTIPRAFGIHSQLDENVAILRIFPGISISIVRAFLAPPLKGVVLQSYGSGNVPDNRQDLMQELKNAAERGVIIVNCTQCPIGTVAPIYETGKVVLELGGLAGFDMTPEAALTKLSYVLSKPEWSLEKKKKVLQCNLRGELTSNDMTEKLCSAAATASLERIQFYQQTGQDISQPDSSGLTPLHVAAMHGYGDIVMYLLDHMENIDATDELGLTALDYAKQYQRQNVVALLSNRSSNN